MTVILADNKALHADAFFEDRRHQQRQAIRAVGQRGGVVAADQAANRHAGRGIQQRQNFIEHFPADVLIVDIDPLRAGFKQFDGEIGRAVIDTDVEAESFYRIAALLAAAGDAHRAAAFQLRDLSDRCANRPGGGGDHQRLARFRLTNIQQPHIGGKAGHAEDPQRPRRVFRTVA